MKSKSEVMFLTWVPQGPYNLEPKEKDSYLSLWEVDHTRLSEYVRNSVCRSLGVTSLWTTVWKNMIL